MSFFVSSPSNSSIFPGKPIEKRVDRLVEAARQVFAQPADAEITREKAKARDELVDVHQQLALPHRVEEHRHRADFQRVRANPHEMARDPLQLGDQHADVLHALRHLEAEKLLDASAKARLFDCAPR